MIKHDSLIYGGTMQPTPWDLHADVVMSLPLDDLALRVLKDAHNSKEWNWQNWLNSARQHAYPGNRSALRALSEAWAWLLNRGLVIWDPEQSSPAAFVISRQGHEALERGLPWLRAVQRLDLQLVPELEAKARPQFLRGDFEAAAFMAMKEVEIRVRALSELSDSLVGTKLMQAAFRLPPKDDVDRASEAGPLWRPDIDPGESVALMDLFKGAIGLFKNPASHRRVDYTDSTEAAEILLLADLLMRLLDKIGATSTGDDSPPPRSR
ncbi:MULTISPECIES: TIGR02391 family protein [Prauserella]|uniref:TIGR02391 family protein n=2 Tax=Prauserella TaxID=142577 RepID=A0A318LLZ7_9PSEU|nr:MULTISPECIES: TIGR02391 family protein [Prauserella]PXY17545.1 TIGR02391 family protein [Prauserella flavalba]PXY18594.1 TIGR02391 family protein [Prauserella coralliicola]TKG63526.1 TIGR02391 family protein [Prauserella endophytica]